jgi:glycosyltransferase involved in cell wall biosynthesis
MAPTYSVIVTAYNEEECIASAIASILSQTHDDLELIVVDDGSTDGTAEAIRPFEVDSRVKLIRQPNMGLSAARNTGVEASDAERVAFLDSDDLWMPDYLEEIHAALESRPDAGFAYTDAWWLQASTGLFYRASAMSRQNPPSRPPEDPTEFLRLLIGRGNFVFVSATVRRAALEGVGLFNTSLTACEDYDLWIRMLARGYGAVRAGEPGDRLAVKRDRSTSMSQNDRNMCVNLREVCRLTELEYDVPDDVKSVAHDRGASLDRDIEAIDGKAPGRAAWQALLPRLGALRKAAMRKRIWHEETPAEVAASFPALARRSRG